MSSGILESSLTDHEYWMERAITLALRAESTGEVPVGAVLVKNGQLLAEGFNASIRSSDPTAHAEIVALRIAGQVERNYRLVGSTLYVTLEPCVMCMGAILNARLERVVFGAYDPQRGALCSQLQLADAPFSNHSLDYLGGIRAERCSEILKRFFALKRQSPTATRAA